MPLNFPNTPANGDSWTDPSNSATYIYVASTNHWKVGGDLGGGGGGQIPPGNIGPLPPVGIPAEGDLWYNTTNGLLYVYESGDWRTAGGADVSATPPTSPISGDYWFNSVNGVLYIWYEDPDGGSSWVDVRPGSGSGGGTGGLTTVATDSPLSGDGTLGNPVDLNIGSLPPAP